MLLGPFSYLIFVIGFVRVDVAVGLNVLRCVKAGIILPNIWGYDAIWGSIWGHSLFQRDRVSPGGAARLCIQFLTVVSTESGHSLAVYIHPENTHSRLFVVRRIRRDHVVIIVRLGLHIELIQGDGCGRPPCGLGRENQPGCWQQPEQYDDCQQARKPSPAFLLKNMQL